MSQARGDQKRCAIDGCVGQMRFGRRGDQETADPSPPTDVAREVRGWVCSLSPLHFRLDSDDEAVPEMGATVSLRRRQDRRRGPRTLA
jgi:hypothetical protein